MHMDVAFSEKAPYVFFVFCDRGRGARAKRVLLRPEATRPEATNAHNTARAPAHLAHLGPLWRPRDLMVAPCGPP